MTRKLQIRLIEANQTARLTHRERTIRLQPFFEGDLSSSDYLGLSRDLAFLESVNRDRLDQFGSTGSRLLGGNVAITRQFEDAFSDWMGGENALFFNSGYHANVGVLASVVGPDDVVLMDRQCHASMIDGVRLSGARFFRFRHNDMDHLERLLQRVAESKGIVWVVTESVFSMDGDVAPLAQLVHLSKRYGAALMVDEAHAIGVLGPEGKGCAVDAGVLSQVDIWVGAFGKAWGGAGAIVMGSDALSTFLMANARSWMFSTALPPVILRWNQMVLGRMPELNARRAHLGAMVNRLGSKTHILPLAFSSFADVQDAAQRFESAGIYAPIIRPPTVAPGTFRLRLSLRSDLPDLIVAAIQNVLVTCQENRLK